MVSLEEREKLMRNYQRAPDCALALVLRGVAGLLFIAGLVVIGVQAERRGDIVAGESHAPGTESHSVEQGGGVPEARARFAAVRDSGPNAAQTADWSSDGAAEPTRIEVNQDIAPPEGE